MLPDKVEPVRSNPRRTPAFIENRGQFDERVRFQLAAGGSRIWLTASGVSFDALRPEDGGWTAKAKKPESGPRLLPPNIASDFERLVVSESFVGANQSLEFEPRDPQPGIYNYLIGNDPAKWHTNIKGYAEVVYRNVWDGVDLRLYPNGSGLEQEFVLAPAGDPSRIQITYKGINALRLAEDGSLIILTAFGQWRESPPKVYQEVAGKRVAINARFKITGEATYAFDLGSYRKEYALVIDPTLLYSTYIGGSGQNYGTGIAVDPSGNAYISGYTYLGTYPTTPGVYQGSCPSSPNCLSAVVSKFDPVGRLQYSTYLGSPLGYDQAQGIAVDANGEVYLTGYSGPGFPTTPNAFQSCSGGGQFMSKLNAAGTLLLYSTCFGGSNSEFGVGAHAIALDAAGRSYVTGSTGPGYGFPTTPDALQPSIGAGYADAFLSVIDPSLSGAASLVYSTYLGPPDPTETSGQAVAVDAYGNAYITGSTNSRLFPVTPNAFQPTNLQVQCLEVGSALCPTAFVTKINPNVFGPPGLIYSSYLGGTSGKDYGDIGYSIAVDPLGSAYVGGRTNSPNFPTTPGAYQPLPFNTNGCAYTGFVTKVNPYGTGKVYSTFLEQNCSQTEVLGLAVDLFGNAYVVGYTGDPNGLFPIMPGAYQPANNGNVDAFLTELNASGSSLVYSSFLGGSGYDSATGVAVDAVGDVAIIGTTESLNFPITRFAYQPTCSSTGSCETAFVTKFPLGAPGALSITGIIPNSGGNTGTVSPQIGGSGFHAGTTAQLNCGTQDLPGANVSVGAGGQLLNTTFDLTATPPGTCGLTIKGVGGTSVTLSNAFAVQQGGTPNIQVYLTGVVARQAPPEEPTAPANAFMLATVSNTGGVDSPGLIATLSLSPFGLTSASPDGLGAGGSNFEVWISDSIAAGASQTFMATGTDVGVPTCGGGFGVQACFPTITGTDLPTFESCLVDTSIWQKLGVTGTCGLAIQGCQLTCGATGPIGCVIACLFGTAVCAAVAGPIISDCLNTAAIHGPPICISDQLPCIQPTDPNNFVGSAGVGGQRWIGLRQALSYAVSFQNEPTATGPAQQVVMTQPLGANVNLSTLRLTGIVIPNGSSNIEVPVPPGSFNPAAGLDEFTTNVDLRPTQSLFVNVDAKLNPATETLTWTFTSIDPTTGLPPLNPTIGFLPPGAGANASFSITPNSGLATGSQVTEQATIVFVGSSPMSTKTWTNTVDNTTPTSRVKTLPTHSCLDLKASWSGTDVGSGIQDYTIYVSDTGAAFTPWLTNTPAISATYQGEDGHTYGFYSIARDRVGNLEASKSAAEATTSVAKTTTCGGPPSLTGSATVQSLSGTILTLALQITNNGTETANNITITKVVPIVLSGVGQVALSSPTLPITVGDLAPGASATVTLVLTMPSTVTNLSLIEPGTVQDAQANTYSYTLGQEVVP
ncbi:MAG: SBBP repeat-containing protein [Bryobacteraceae bacterium]|jgi:hypothetical protein